MASFIPAQLPSSALNLSMRTSKRLVSLSTSMALAVVAVFLSWTSWPDISAAVTSFTAAQTRCPSGWIDTHRCCRYRTQPLASMRMRMKAVCSYGTERVCSFGCARGAGYTRVPPGHGRSPLTAFILYQRGGLCKEHADRMFPRSTPIGARIRGKCPLFCSTLSLREPAGSFLTDYPAARHAPRLPGQGEQLRCVHACRLTQCCGRFSLGNGGDTRARRAGVEPQSSLHGKSSGSLPLCTRPFYSCVPLASAGSEEDLSPSTSSNPLSSSSDNETSSCAARGAQETKYVAAYPFRNHVLFDESVFARMNQLRHLIHKMECSPNKDISPEQIEDKFLPLLCEGDLLERTLELARTNYRQQAANASAGDTARLSSLLGQNKPSETDTSGPDRDEAEWRGTSSLLARNAVEGSVGNAHVQPSSARSNNDAQGSRIDELNGGTSALGGALTTSGPLTSLQRLEHLAPQLLAVARYHRRRQAKRKVERLLAAMLTGDVARIDALFLQMAEQKLLDSHLLNLIDELIHEAHMKYSSYKAKEALSETALKTLKRRILAHLEMMKTNRQDFVRILSLCFQTQTEKRRAILKASLYTVDDLERFQEWLEDGIKFAEDTGKLKEDQVKVMKNLVEDCKRANPLNTAPLDRWDEDNAFQADLNLQAAWETSGDFPSARHDLRLDEGKRNEHDGW